MKALKLRIITSAVLTGSILTPTIGFANSAKIDIPIRIGLKQAGSGFAQATCEIQNQRPENGSRVLARNSKTTPLVFREARHVSGIAQISLEGLELGKQESLQYSYSCKLAGYRAVIEGDRVDGRTFPGDDFIPRGAYFPGDDFVRKNTFYQDSQMSTAIRGNGEVMLRKRPSRIPN